MIRKLFSLLILLAAGVIGYNYFYGDSSEKAQSERIINQVKELGNAVGDLIKDEKQKMDEGKYDAVFDKLGKVYKDLRNGLGKLDDKLMNEIDRLENEKDELEEKRDRIKIDRNTPQSELDEINLQIEKLYQKTESLIRKIDSKQ